MSDLDELSDLETNFCPDREGCSARKVRNGKKNMGRISRRRRDRPKWQRQLIAHNRCDRKKTCT